MMEARAKDLRTGQLKFGTINITPDKVEILEDGIWYVVDEASVDPFLGEDKYGQYIYVGDLVKNLLGYGIPFVATTEDAPLIQRGEVILVSTNYGDDR